MYSVGSTVRCEVMKQILHLVPIKSINVKYFIFESDEESESDLDSLRNSCDALNISLFTYQRPKF